MRYVEVVYKCKCMAAEAQVQVRERQVTEPVDEWVLNVMAVALTIDHKRRSPQCTLTKMEYAKLAIPHKNAPIGKAEGGNA